MGIPLGRPGFKARPSFVEFVMAKVALGQIFLWAMSASFHQCPVPIDVSPRHNLSNNSVITYDNTLKSERKIANCTLQFSRLYYRINKLFGLLGYPKR
jgi:hypothetical protein